MIDSLRSLSIGWWLLASLALSILAANLSWRLQSWSDGRGRRIGALALRVSSTAPLVGAGRFAFNIGVPYAALLLGSLDARLAGLTGLDWLHSLGVGTVFAIATAALLWLDRVHLHVTAPSPSSAETVPPPTRSSVLATLWLVAFQQAHWAFYRSGATVLLGAYNGVFAGLTLVIIEWILNPAWRAGWMKQQQSFAFDLALALTTTILFLLTGNLWVCALVHGVIALLLGSERQNAYTSPSEQAQEHRSPGI